MESAVAAAGAAIAIPAIPAISSTVGEAAPAADDPWSQRFAAPEPAKPQVAAEDDEYSMSDESLGTATALDVDELSRIFEVKKIEDFTADDPKNPRNMQTKKSLDD